MEDLIKKIACNTAKIGIIGLGYVGLPLAISFAKRFSVIGYDVNKKIINNLSIGKSHIKDVPDIDIKNLLFKSFHPTSDEEKLKECDFKIICVPTPLTKEKKPDLSYIKSACQMVSKVLNKGQFVILESTTYPGTTSELVVPILEKSGLTAENDFGVAFSPERIDPGNVKFNVENTPKIVGGINEQCTEIGAMLYRSVIAEVIKVRDDKTAEAVKLVENIFRNVNIGLINELSLIFEIMGIDTWEVINAASTKPYGFMPFYPGPGVGGHCIPLDPLYMSYKAQRCGFIPRFIELSEEINEFMKIHVLNLIEKGLNEVDKDMHDSTIAVFGLAYKKNIEDTRESPSIKIIEELVNSGANVKVYDPYVKRLVTETGSFSSEENIDFAFSGSDCAVFLIDHDVFKTINLVREKDLMNYPIIIDCKNIFDGNNGLIYLGLGKASSISKSVLEVPPSVTKAYVKSK